VLEASFHHSINPSIHQSTNPPIHQSINPSIILTPCLIPVGIRASLLLDMNVIRQTILDTLNKETAFVAKALFTFARPLLIEFSLPDAMLVP
jgi:hypothetical protein